MHAFTSNTHLINYLSTNQPFQVSTQNRHLDKKICGLTPSTCAAFGTIHTTLLASVQSVPAPTWKQGTTAAIRPCGSYDPTGLHRARLNGSFRPVGRCLSSIINY
jgi:hypothetical protein